MRLSVPTALKVTHRLDVYGAGLVKSQFNIYRDRNFRLTSACWSHQKQEKVTSSRALGLVSLFYILWPVRGTVAPWHCVAKKTRCTPFSVCPLQSWVHLVNKNFVFVAVQSYAGAVSTPYYSVLCVARMYYVDTAARTDCSIVLRIISVTMSVCGPSCIRVYVCNP